MGGPTGVDANNSIKSNFGFCCGKTRAGASENTQKGSSALASRKVQGAVALSIILALAVVFSGLNHFNVGPFGKAASWVKFTAYGVQNTSLLLLGAIGVKALLDRRAEQAS